MRNKKISGLKAKTNGKIFEGILDKYFSYYAAKGYCNIEKTPEPYRFIKPYSSYLFVGCFLKSAQPDYKGTLKGGRSIVLEAKSVSNGRINLSALTENEYKQLKLHKELGACTGVIVYDSVESNIYLLPFIMFEEMENLFKLKHIKLNLLQKFEISKKLNSTEITGLFNYILSLNLEDLKLLLEKNEIN